jgi:hypothetical protein
VLRVRIFAQDGSLLFSTDPDDKGGDVRVGDADSIRAASVGSTASSVGSGRVSTRSGPPVSTELLQIYAPLTAGKGKSPGVVGVDERFGPIEAASQQPWQTARLGAEIAAAVFAVFALLLLGRRAAAKRATAKAKRAAAAPKPAQDAPAPEPPPTEQRKSFRKGPSSGPPAPSNADRALKDAQREVQVREALEGQLEQLRTRIREQEDLANRHVLELTQQLQVAAARIEDAEARAASSPAGEDAARIAEAERLANDGTQRASQAEARAAAAESRVTELELRLASAQATAVAPPTDERVLELERALAAAREEAADNARRAEATEAVRAELEIKVAQFGSRAQEQESTAGALAEQLREIEAVRADLERRASEAESGGDAVRSVVAQLSAERDALRARVEELERREPMTEATAAPAAGIEELEQLASARAELGDLRQQLGNAIARAATAEERAAKLEADLLAERQGVRELMESPHTEGREAEYLAEPPVDAPVDDGGSTLDEPENPFPWMNGNGNGNGIPPDEDEQTDPDRAEDADQPGDKSLRYRLAQSAARKKGLGEVELPSS